MIAAGGLGTRVGGWSPFLPKEFRPVDGRPGLLHVLDEVAATGIRRTVVVHHPYYTPFVDWVRQVLTPGTLARYRDLAGQAPPTRSVTEGLPVEFIAQHGRYADVTSALNGSEYLGSTDVCVVFSDNVDPGHRALGDLVGAAEPGVPAVLAAEFDVRAASSHGVILCGGRGAVRTMCGLVEKPDPFHARQLVSDHGAHNLRLLLGRMHLTPQLLHRLSAGAHRTTSEPRLSLEVAEYARRCRVDVVTTSSQMIDLGVADTPGTAPSGPVPA
ncbi:hypothetical protein AB0L85_13335 [Streptomyces sp. NPDC052051]|uniref:hypothetical protein n=1 Tax=Streptomyces sp. NPDC052051 TaxID=3154649 RepID=UPI00342BCC16